MEGAKVSTEQIALKGGACQATRKFPVTPNKIHLNSRNRKCFNMRTAILCEKSSEKNVVRVFEKKGAAIVG
jgi:hypothetical protein